MELAFDNKKLRSICEDFNIARAEYGDEVSNKLIRRLADLQAAVSVEDLVVGSPSTFNEESEITYKIDLANNHRLVFCANHVKVPRYENGEVDWLKVRNIKILRIDNLNE